LGGEYIYIYRYVWENGWLLDREREEDWYWYRMMMMFDATSQQAESSLCCAFPWEVILPAQRPAAVGRAGCTGIVYRYDNYYGGLDVL
jgi:hypothetical protein